MYLRIMALAIFMMSASASAETTSSLSTGFDYNTGKYGGTSSTTIWYIPVTAKIQTDNLFLKLTVPYISMTSDGTTGVIPGMGRMQNTTTTSNKTVTRSGLGDVIASAGYTIVDNDSLMLDLVGNIKFGTADAGKNLGTGKNDYSAQLDGFYTFSKTTVLATVGYKIIGEPANVTVNNIAYGSLGISQKIADKISAGFIYDAAQSSTEINPGTRELSVFVTNKISTEYKINASLMKGFSDSSPDYGCNLMLTGSF